MTNKKVLAAGAAVALMFGVGAGIAAAQTDPPTTTTTPATGDMDDGDLDAMCAQMLEDMHSMMDDMHSMMDDMHSTMGDVHSTMDDMDTNDMDGDHTAAPSTTGSGVDSGNA